MTHKRTAVKAMLCCLAIATVVFSPKVLCEDQPSISSESKHENELIQRVETEFADAAKAIGESVYPHKCTVIESGVCKSDCVYSGYESLPDSATINSTSACGIEGSFVDAELCGACHGVQRITTSPTLFGISGATRNYYDSSSNSIASTTNNNNINNDANNEEMEPSSSPYSGPEGEKTRSVDEDACWTRGVDNYLSDLYGKFAGKFLWVSYVAPSGVARVYPGLLRPEHDEAFSAHPWYSAPLAGAKDVVFLLDQSDSVKRNSVWSKAKQLLDTILDSSVSASDYIAAYAVSGNPQRLGTLDTPPDTLERATAGTCYTLRSTFCKSNGGGGSRLSVAFSRAVKLLESSAAEGQTSGCAAHIVLISDADINESTGKIMRDLNKAAERFARNIGRPLHVHVYGLGKYADEDLLRRVTCQHNGVFVRIGKDEEITLDHARAWLTYSVAERTVARAVGSLKSVRNVAWSSIDYLKPSNRMGAVVSIPVYSTINRHFEV